MSICRQMRPFVWRLARRQSPVKPCWPIMAAGAASRWCGSLKPMEAPFPPFEPNGRVDSSRGPKLSQIPLRIVVPNVITVLAICAGLTGIRLAFENRFALAVELLLVSAFLDGFFGHHARM